MRWIACALMLVSVATIGCNQPTETIPVVTPAGSDSGSGVTADGDQVEVIEVEGEPAASNSQAEVIRFVADQRLSVPDMSCPYACWPKVKETLAAQPGVEGVQLAEQPADAQEGEITERIVELKLNDQFDADAAIAALSKVSFAAQIAE